MKRETLKRTALLALVLLLVLLRAQAIHAAGLKNLAVLRLHPLWLEQSEPILDPPCRAGGTLADLAQMLQPSIDLGDVRALTHLGRVQWLVGRCAEAIAAWEQAWTGARDQAAAFELIRLREYDVLSPDTRRMAADRFYDQARGLTKTRGDQSALAWFDRAVDLAPHHKYASAIAQIYRKEDDTANVRRVWQRLVDLTPNTDAEHWWAVAELASLDGKWEAAAQAYTTGARLSNEPYEFWTGAGSAWLRARQFDAALTAYERAYQEKPSAWSCILLGLVYRSRQQYTEALRWYAEAQAKSPRDAEVYYRFGETYYVMGDYARARQYLDQALQMDADHFLSMYVIAKIYYNQGDAASAEKWMLDALARIPWRDTRAAWWMELGDWRLQWRDCDGARVAYANAREMNVVAEQTIQSKTKKLAEICAR